MGSLSDPDNVGARLKGAGHRYGARRSGPGRWARLDGVGILWTDDDDSVQLSDLAGADSIAAYVLIGRLHALAEQNVPATQTFDRIVAERGATAVTIDDLAELVRFSR